MTRSRILRLAFAALACLALALATAAPAGWTSAKGALSQVLLERAWRAGLARADAPPVRPWPWADARAVARLEVPSLGVSRIVLDGASGAALAFGPGLVAGDPSRADAGPVALGGHRDTHLAFLRHVAPGTELHLHALDGRTHRYLAGAGRTVDVRRETLALAPDTPGLVLVTCWPFDAPTAGGPLRWAVAARPIGRDAAEPVPSDAIAIR